MASHDGSSNVVDIEVQLPDTCGAADTTSTDEGPRGRKHLCIGFLRAKPISILLSYVVRVFHLLWCVVKTMLVSLFGILYFLFYLIIRPDDIRLLIRLHEDFEEDEKHEKDASIKRKRTTIKYKLRQLNIVTTVRMGCVVLTWVVINLSVSSLRRVTFLGSLLWKWSLLVSLILVTYPFLIVPFNSRILLSAISRAFYKHEIFESNMAYCMMGLDCSVTLLVYFTSILIAWLQFIDTKSPNLRHYGTLTLVSFLVGAVLSVMKSVVILLWKAKLIYSKYEGKILLAGCQLFFHLYIMGQQLPESFSLVSWSLGDKRHKTKRWIEDHSEQQAIRRKISPIEKYLFEQGANIQHLDMVATYLTNNFELSLTENNDIPDIVPYLREKVASIMKQPGFTATYENLPLDVPCERLLHKLLQLETSKEHPTYEDFEKWMVESHKNCYAAGHMINGAMEVTKILDRVFTGFIFVVVFLVWLFITKFASTKVVIGLGSIFVGLTFMFGDTCKTFFQGVIFSFVTHPFDVSDRCIIDNNELRVKRINILTTTFFGSKSKETFMYPNSDLATKHIVILRGEPEQRQLEPGDFIELNLPCSTKARHIESLQKKIEGYIEDGIRSGRYKEPYRVSLKEIGSNIKMGVHFQHNLSDGDESEQLEATEIRKDKQRSKLLIQLRKFQEDVTGSEVSPP